MKEKKKFQMPHIFIILYAIILVIAALSYILPAGEYTKVLDPNTGREIIDPNSYHVIASTPTTVMQLFQAFPSGFVEAGWVVVLTFCVCGGFYMVNKSGAIGGVITWLSNKLKDKGIIIIPILMVTFAAIDCFIGMCELCMVYVPIILPLMLMLGFDSMTACATALCGSAIGFTSALANPFTTIIGQKIAGLPLLSGWQYRLISMIVVGAIGIGYVMRYASMVKKDPTKSLVYESDLELRKQLDLDNKTEYKLNFRQKLAGVIALVLFIIMIIGVFKWGWDLPQIGGIFMAMGIVPGLVSGMTGNELCENLPGRLPAGAFRRPDRWTFQRRLSVMSDAPHYRYYYPRPGYGTSEPSRFYYRSWYADCTDYVKLPDPIWFRTDCCYHADHGSFS